MSEVPAFQIQNLRITLTPMQGGQFAVDLLATNASLPAPGSGGIQGDDPPAFAASFLTQNLELIDHRGASSGAKPAPSK